MHGRHDLTELLPVGTAPRKHVHDCAGSTRDAKGVLRKDVPERSVRRIPARTKGSSKYSSENRLKLRKPVKTDSESGKASRKMRRAELLELVDTTEKYIDQARRCRQELKLEPSVCTEFGECTTLMVPIMELVEIDKVAERERLTDLMEDGAGR